MAKPTNPRSSSEAIAREKAPLPNRVREWRKARGLTLQQLAARPRVGIDFSHLAKIETGERELTKPVMERLAAALGVEQADLLNPADGGLTEQERELIRTYRAIPPAGRAAIDAVAESQQPFLHGEVVDLTTRKSA